jgi:exosortase family protein XrtG
MNTQLLIWALATLVWATVTFALWRARRWLLFYLTAGFGFVLLVTFGAASADLDTAIEALEAAQVAALSVGLGIGVQVVNLTGLAIPNQAGWAVFDIGLECSAILEMSAIVGLTAFYPAFSAGRRAVLAAIGIAITYVVNIVRILLIVGVIAAFGTDWVFFAHAVLGRVVFFICTVALYWFVLTRPTVAFTRARVEELRADG